MLQHRRGQSYDFNNVMHMADIICKDGFQAQITMEFNLALFVSCSSHSLNLVGTYICTVKFYLEAINFLVFIQKHYAFLSPQQIY